MDSETVNRGNCRHVIQPHRSQVIPPEDFIPFEAQAIHYSLIQRFEQIAHKYPESVAIRSDDLELRYAELNRAANQLAHAILSMRGRASEPIPFILEHGPASIIAMLGIMKAGKAYVPVDPFYPPAWITHILDDVQAGLILTNNQNLPLTMTSLETSRAAETLNLDALESDLPDVDPGLVIAPVAMAYILYTSGSTGRPRGVIHSHIDAIHNMIAQTNDLALSPSDRLALFISLGFEASRFAIYGALHNAGTLCLYDIRSRGLVDLPGWIDQHRISVLLSTPSTFRHMNSLVPEDKRFSSVRLIVLGGEPVTSQDVTLFRRHFRECCILVNTLGTTEIGIITRLLIDSDYLAEGHSLPAGFPIGDKRIELVDEDNQPVGQGQVGEILVKSRYLSPGYWRQPSLNESKFTKDPADESVRIFHSGDLGRLLPDGCLEHLGRKDAQIKIRGFRVDVAELEAVIHQHPDVKNSAVITRESRHLNNEKQLVAYVECGANSALSKEGLQNYLANKLPDYMLPAAIVFMDSMPLTHTGKINRAALPELEALGRDQERAYMEPRDDLERQLAKIWERVLGVRPIGVQDDYFELGGNSLLAAQLFAQIEKTFGKKLPLATLFQASKIERLAEILRQQDWVSDWSSLVALRTQGQRLPLFFAAPVGGNVLSYHDLVLHLPPDQPCYGLQALGLDGTQTVHRSVRDIAAHYIHEIQAVQPDGPYYLLGSSFGGLVVYEMAQQLHDQGQIVALVAMFDAYGPDYPRRPIGTSRIRRKIYRYLRRIDTHLSNLAILNWEERALYVRVKGLKLLNRLSRRWRNRINQIRNPLPRNLKRVHTVHMSASKRKKRYLREPRRFSGRLVLFRAAKQILGAYPDPKLGWGAVVGDNIDVYEIPGHHTSIIYEPRVRLLAGKLNEILNEVQALEPSGQSEQEQDTSRTND